jgi:Flp pilus assembly protein TadG
VLVLVAVMLVVLLGMMAFAIDIGFIVHARTELQRTADSCALAAAMFLPDANAARSTAISTATMNYGTIGPKLKSSDIEFGYWDRDTATFTTPTPAGKSDNAVRVALSRSRSTGNPLRLFFASVLGEEWGSAQASAIAMADHHLCGPFVGIQWVDVPGSVATDSYDSSEGSYYSGAVRDRGSVCSDGPIMLDGNTYIRGDARSGKDHSVTLSGNPVVTRSIGSRLKPLNIPPVDASEAAITNDNDQVPLIQKGNSWESPLDANGNFHLDGTKTLDLPPGTYYFNDMVLEGQATLNISGPTTIYMTGNLSRAGGVNVNNSTQNSSNLQIQMTGGQANVTSDGPFYGVIYAPNTDVVIDGSSEYFGAVVGKTLTITGDATGHYDESLGLHNGEFPRRSSLVD